MGKLKDRIYQISPELANPLPQIHGLFLQKCTADIHEKNKSFRNISFPNGQNIFISIQINLLFLSKMAWHDSWYAFSPDRYCKEMQMQINRNYFFMIPIY